MAVVRCSFVLLAGVLFLGGALCGNLPAADPDAVTFTDPEKAGIDYQIQGEYLGNLPTNEGDQQFGVQVIARGDGKFRAIAHQGGLPGAGWSRSDETYVFDGQLEDKVAELEMADGNYELHISEGVLDVFQGDTKVAEFPKVDRKSPTLGAKAPDGALVLFDGSSLDAWDNAELVDGKWLGASSASTKQTFGDHTLHIEFRTPFMPNSRGQARGNSGVYVQSRYEVQVLDSFGLDGRNNECGGIYSIARPAVNMCLPPLAWQTYDMDFTAARYDAEGKKTSNARVTIRHNGVAIHDDLELPNGTPGRHPEGPEPDGLFLQHHGNPVVFRNIWVVQK